jgi:alpha-methylacyl-CoA racemase
MTPARPSPSGPLAGIGVVEFAGIGPAPFGAMVLADLGADVVRIDRVDQVDESAWGTPNPDAMMRGRRSVAIDLKAPEGVDAALRLVDGADVLVEGFRPGVMERLGLGSDRCLERNERLVYVRMTGWGQEGPWAGLAGHDIDYLAISGALGATGRRGHRPVPPANFLGDFGGGGMLLVVGTLAALLERERSGRGQVVDAAVLDGAALLSTMVYGLMELGTWTATPGENIADTGAPFYDVYRAADGSHVALGAVEPQFYDQLVEGLGLDDDELPDQMDRSQWPRMKETFARAVAARSRDDWDERLGGTDCCYAPVLHPVDAWRHPHNAARHTFVDVEGVRQPAPAPRFSRTPAPPPGRVPHPGEHTAAVLTEAGFGPGELLGLRGAGAVGPLGSAAAAASGDAAP